MELGPHTTVGRRDHGGAYPLSRHVPRLALDWVVDEPERQWKLVEGSMVFADISGFTALSERLATRGRIGAEELVETLSRVFGAMFDIAAERGGQLLKFGGDALLFLVTGRDHALQACATAVELRAELRRASEIVTSVGRLNLKMSTGVHSGQFHMFLVGAPHRELVVLGPGTTTVVMCENAANAGEIVVSRDLAELLPRGSTRPRHDGHLLLRWRQSPVEPSGGLPSRHTDADAAQLLVPKILADVLEGAQPDPAHRVAVLSFMRFSGTDEMLAEQGPDVVASAVHETLCIAQEAFIAEDVALLCVDCDVGAAKIFCSSGVPITSEDDEGRVLRAAKAIVAADPPLPLQIGINRGHVFAAEMGTARRAAFSAMGDTTNTAARICSKTPQRSIYVHPSVLDHARTRYEFQPVGPFVFKGKTEPQTLYDVGDELGPRQLGEVADLPFIGRDAEREILLERCLSVAEGFGDVVVVTGRVGLGKTRLIREVVPMQTGLRTIAVHAEPYGASSAYRVFRDPLRALLGIERASQPRMAVMLRRAVRRLVPHLEPLLPLIADVAHINVPSTPDVEVILPQYRPDRTADALVELFRALTTGPTVFVVEDAHWVDDASEHLLSRLAEATRLEPWLIVVARRDEEGGFDPEGAVQIALEPLPPDVIRELTAAATEAAPLRPHEVDQVVERAAGNPMFVGEVVRAAQELGSLDAVPASLQGTMAAQVDALDPLARRVLSYASVLGRSFRRRVFAEVLRAEHLQLDPATLQRLGRFLEEDGPERFRFRNGLVRDVTYDGLGYNLRARLHLEAGEAVERISVDPAADADTLALHFAAAGDHIRTYTYAVLAAERATRAHANADAAAHYERALEGARRMIDVTDDERRRLWTELGHVRDQAGLFDGALDAYRRAIACSDGDALLRSDLLLHRARVRERSGQFALALRDTTRSRSALGERDDIAARSAKARAAAFVALVRQRQERAVEALRAASAAVTEAKECGERSALARAYNVISWAGLVLGHSDAAEYAARALALYEQLDDLVGQADMANNLGIMAYFDGRWDDTLELYRRSEEACRRVGNVVDAAASQANIAEVLVNQRRIDEAEPVARGAARALRASGYVWGATFAELQLGRILVERGDLPGGEAMLSACVEGFTRMGKHASAYETSLHLADCFVRAYRPHDALAVVDQAAARTSDDVSILAAARARVVAQAQIEMGFVDEAITTIGDGVVHARERGLEFDLARLLLLAAELGRPHDPRLGTSEPAEEAQALFDRLGVVTPIAV